MKLHERLRELRSERGLRLKDVAETAGISVPYLSDLERGRTNPSLETLQTLAGSYAITVHDLLEGVEFYGGQPIFDVFQDASGQVDTEFTWGPTMTDTYTALSDGFTAALNGDGTLSEALSAAQTSSLEALRAQGIQVDG